MNYVHPTILNKVILLYILDLVILRIVKSKKMCFIGYSEIGDEVCKHRDPQMYEKTAVYVQLYSYI
jgi:hypothetical protein